MQSFIMEPSYLGNSNAPAGAVTESDRLLGILAHVLTFFTWIFGPLVIYLLKKDESLYVREHARESLNFQLTLVVYYIIAFILMFVIIGIFAFIFIGFMQLVLVIVASIKAADNKLYRYPLTIRFIS